MNFLKNLAFFFSRLFFSVYFAIYAYHQAFHPGAARNWLGVHSYIALTGAVLCEVLGAASLFLGYKTPIGSVLLLLVAARATWMSGGHFVVLDGNTVDFLKNLLICAGLLTLFASGPGDWSLERSGGGGGKGKAKE